MDNLELYTSLSSSSTPNHSPSTSSSPPSPDFQIKAEIVQLSVSSAAISNSHQRIDENSSINQISPSPLQSSSSPSSTIITPILTSVQTSPCKGISPRTLFQPYATLSSSFLNTSSPNLPVNSTISGGSINKSKSLSASSTGIIQQHGTPTPSSPSRQIDLQRELDLRHMELHRKDDEIKSLREQLSGLSEQYTLELSFCCKYSNSLQQLQKEFQSMKNQFISREEQYKKQVQDLQQKLYSNNKD